MAGWSLVIIVKNGEIASEMNRHNKTIWEGMRGN